MPGARIFVFPRDRCLRVLAEYETAKVHAIATHAKNKRETEALAARAADDSIRALRSLGHEVDASRARPTSSNRLQGRSVVHSALKCQHCGAGSMISRHKRHEQCSTKVFGSGNCSPFRPSLSRMLVRPCWGLLYSRSGRSSDRSADRRQRPSCRIDDIVDSATDIDSDDPRLASRYFQRLELAVEECGGHEMAPADAKALGQQSL